MGITRTADFGSWASAIDARAVASAAMKLADIRCDAASDESALYWLESRPEESGRNCIVRQGGGDEVEDYLPPPWSARSAVHEYGGAAFAVYAGTVWFVNAKDQAIYQRSAEGDVTQITDRGRSFADLQYDPASRCLYAVCETPQEGAQARASVVRIGMQGQITELACGRDFYASPRLSPDGRQLVWLCWDHPNMPWDGCEMWALALDSEHGSTQAKYLAGGVEESLFQPQFAPNGDLYIVSDREDGWWNIFRLVDGCLQAVTREQAEFGVPQWVFGQSTYCFDSESHLYTLFTRDGLWELARVDTETGELAIYDLPFTHLEQLRCVGNTLFFLAGSATQAQTLCSLDSDSGKLRIIRCAGSQEWDESSLSTPDALTYETANGEHAHALYYPPLNPEFHGPPGQKPPLLIKCHGGPTGATTTTLDPRIQFWTSRGFAVLDVNYRGSTGYGRAYRKRLYGSWGISDVEDCEYGARYLADQGLIDPNRVVITGSSAGGYTVLCVLCFTDLMAAGTSYYGIADLERLLASTHKFESRYLGRLIGEDPELLRQRSPLYHAEKVTCPVLFLQGLKDKVVPPDQATAMVDVLRERGVPVAYISFSEERHGFKSADNIVRALESELAFYAQILGFNSSDDIPPRLREHFSSSLN